MNQKVLCTNTSTKIIFLNKKGVNLTELVSTYQCFFCISHTIIVNIQHATYAKKCIMNNIKFSFKMMCVLSNLPKREWVISDKKEFSYIVPGIFVYQNAEDSYLHFEHKSYFDCVNKT